ncbi:uncharacterized protein [Montipora foliosa]|uniref:uncharacterized protein n=1 Tax=Montipora foliosa TaxID=591990 RepID=UPI0035F16F08
MSVKVADYRNHLRFNLRCLHEHVTPCSVKLRSPIPGNGVKKILENAERKLLNSYGVRRKHPVVPTPASEEPTDKKFDKLRHQSREDLDKDWRQTKTPLTGAETAKWVKNLSDRPLSDSEISVLEKGSNFAVTPNRLPVVDFITVTGNAICLSSLYEAKSELLRSKVCDTFCKNKARVMNLNKDEREAVDCLTKDENVVIVSADKGRCLVVLKREDYDQKCKSLLDDKKTYKPLGYNPTNGFGREIELTTEETITSYDDSALFTSIPADEAITTIRQRLKKDETFAKRTCLSIEEVVELVDICLTTTYFSFKGKFYKQIHGCAMGSPISPIVANLCMEVFEQRALGCYNGVRPRLWLRYVDDTFVILEKNETSRFLDHLNSQDVNIKFTQEQCTNNLLPFLDCLVKINSDGSLSTSVYRKPTHTDHYLQFSSHHPLIHKLGMIRTLEQRANTLISHPEEVEKEKEHIRKALNLCGYPSWAFQKATSPSQRDHQRQGQEQRTGPRGFRNIRITIPYVTGVSDAMKSVFRSFGFSTTFKPCNTLRQKLVNVKDMPRKDKISHVIYGIRCGSENCSETYVGETKQALGSRMGQHKRPSTIKAQNSAVYNHLRSSEHSFDLSDVKILAKEENWVRRGIKEAVCERVQSPSLNKKRGLRFVLSHIWDCALREVPSQLSRDTCMTQADSADS